MLDNAESVLADMCTVSFLVSHFRNKTDAVLWFYKRRSFVPSSTIQGTGNQHIFCELYMWLHLNSGDDLLNNMVILEISISILSEIECKIISKRSLFLSLFLPNTWQSSWAWSA